MRVELNWKIDGGRAREISVRILCLEKSILVKENGH